jgi:hypothetical protein
MRLDGKRSSIVKQWTTPSPEKDNSRAQREVVVCF